MKGLKTTLRMVCCPLALFAAKGSDFLWCCLKIPLCPSWAYFARFTFSVDKEWEVKSTIFFPLCWLWPVFSAVDFFALKRLCTSAFHFYLPWKAVLESGISHNRKSFDQVHLLFLLPCLCSCSPQPVYGSSGSCSVLSLSFSQGDLICHLCLGNCCCILSSFEWWTGKALEEFSSPLCFQNAPLSGLVSTGLRRADIREKQIEPVHYRLEARTKAKTGQCLLTSPFSSSYPLVRLLHLILRGKRDRGEEFKEKVGIAWPQLCVTSMQ